VHLEKSKRRNEENEGTLTVPEWRRELVFEVSTGFLAISWKGICKVFLKTQRMGEISTVASPEGGSPELAVLPLN